jgi:hypothetical protein
MSLVPDFPAPAVRPLCDRGRVSAHPVAVAHGRSVLRTGLSGDNRALSFLPHLEVANTSAHPRHTSRFRQKTS